MHKEKPKDLCLTQKIELYRRMQKRRDLIFKLRTAFYDHEDAGCWRKNYIIQYRTYRSLKALYERIPGYHPVELKGINKWLAAHRDYRIGGSR